MGFLDALVSPRAAVDASDFDLGEGWKSTTSDSGVVVTAESAMRLVSVYACVTLIADAIRSLPVDVFRKTRDHRVPVSRTPGWVSSPNQNQTWGQFVDFVLHSLLTNGNAFVWLPSRDFLAFPDVLEVIHPDDVQVNRVEGRKRILVNGEEFSEFNQRNPGGEVLHILGHSADGLVGLSPIEQARQAIGSGLAIEEFGNRFFSNGAVTSGVVEMPAGSNPTDEQLKRTSKQFDRKHSGLENAWKPIVLANGAAYKPMSIAPDEAQFIESSKLSSAEIAKLYRIPPHLIGDVERSTSWGTGIEQQGIGFVTYTLNPWLVRLEEAFNQLLPRGQFLKFNVNALLRGDAAARGAFYQTLGQLKAIHINEIRASEDMPPLPGGDMPPPAPNESI